MVWAVIAFRDVYVGRRDSGYLEVKGETKTRSEGAGEVLRGRFVNA